MRLPLALAAYSAACGVLAVGPATASPAPHRQLLGSSVDGRPIYAVEVGDPAGARKVLVVGCVHGNECAGTAITSLLAARRPLPGVDLWIVPSLNPDGAAAGTRGNAHGVDLNRNFPWRWQRAGGVFDSGPRSLSEPESRIAYHLIVRLRPTISIWFHQQLNLVDESGGSSAVERRFAALAGQRLARLQREPGSIVTWENHRFNGTAFVDELPAGRLSRVAAVRFADAVAKLAGH